MSPWLYATLERSRVKRAARGLLRAIRAPGIPVIRPKLVRVMPHDALAHTQGLACVGGTLYESAGLVGSSSLRRLDIDTGEIVEERSVPHVWAEGIAGHCGSLLQLTYTSGKALRYRLPALAPDGSFEYSGEGWGLARFGAGYLMSNGSEFLTIRDAAFEPRGRLEVRLAGKPLRLLNDLECVGDRIYANVFGHHDIYELSAETGNVERIVDCTEVLRRSGRKQWGHVLNGIAFAAERGTFFVTGKHWPTLFELEWHAPPKPAYEACTDIRRRL